MLMDQLEQMERLHLAALVVLAAAVLHMLLGRAVLVEILALPVLLVEIMHHTLLIQHMAQEPEVLPEQQEMLVIRDLVFLAII
jgi:hypothetical protein